jgi:hypothetical protein
LASIYLKISENLGYEEIVLYNVSNGLPIFCFQISFLVNRQEQSCREELNNLQHFMESRATKKNFLKILRILMINLKDDYSESISRWNNDLCNLLSSFKFILILMFSAKYVFFDMFPLCYMLIINIRRSCSRSHNLGVENDSSSY